MRNRILSVGQNRQLQLLRQDLLQAAGYRVDVVTTRAEAVLALGEEHYDVAILCDSLPRTESDKLAHDVEIVAPSTAILRLNFLSIPLADVAPEVLLQCVRAVVRRGDTLPATRLRRTR